MNREEFDYCCRKCGKKLTALDSCGTGTTWSLLKCSSCEQLHAVGSIIPRSVVDDKSIITVRQNPIKLVETLDIQERKGR